MEKSAGERQISTSVSAVAKCRARLVWKESPVSQVPSLVIPKSATVSHPNTHVFVSLKILHTKITRATRILCSQYYGKTKQLSAVRECPHVSASQVVFGEKHVASDPPRFPGCYGGGQKSVWNINQLDALNFIISLFQASTCFKNTCSSSGGQKLYYTVSGIITPIGVMIQILIYLQPG